jgi:hypothetical protein
MEAAIDDAFDQVLNFDMWEEVAAMLAGFFAPTVLRNLTSGVVPNAVDYREAYGLAVVAGGQFSPAYASEISIGGGLYTADALAERAGIKSTVMGVGN